MGPVTTGSSLPECVPLSPRLQRGVSDRRPPRAQPGIQCRARPPWVSLAPLQEPNEWPRQWSQNRTGRGSFEGRGLEPREGRKRRGRYVAAPPPRPQPRVGSVWRHPFWLRGAHRSSRSRAPTSSHEPLQFPGPLARAVHPANSSADAPTPSSPPWGCPCLHGTALSRAHPTQGPP